MNRKLLLSAAALTAFASSTLAACGGDDDAPGTAATQPATLAAASPARTAAKEGPVTLNNPTVTPSGLKYTDQVVGSGASPRMDQQVTVHYTGKLAANGKVFDSSVQKGQPATFPMAGVIKGFSEGLSTMKVGGKRTVFIPAALGYGERGSGPIPGNADLIFEIELIAIK